MSTETTLVAFFSFMMGGFFGFAIFSVKQFRDRIFSKTEKPKKQQSQIEVFKAPTGEKLSGEVSFKNCPRCKSPQVYFDEDLKMFNCKHCDLCCVIMRVE